MGKITIHLLFVFFYCLTVSSQTFQDKWVSIGGNTQKDKTVVYEVLESSVTRYKVKVTINGLHSWIESREGENFYHLFFDNNLHLNLIGAPSLPVIIQSIAIPTNASLKVSLIEIAWDGIEMGMVYPSQSTYMEEVEFGEFKINNQFYKQNFAPDLLRIGEKMKWRSVDYVNLQVCPFVYHGTSNQLSVLSEFVIQVDFSYMEMPENPQAPLVVDNSYRLFNNVSQWENKGESRNLREGTEDSYDYLIIVGSGLTTILDSDAMKKFRYWKALKGLKTKVVTTSVTGIYDNSIKSYITQEQAKGIRYVLFVGDTDKIPLHSSISFSNTSHSIMGDYWYGCIGGESDVTADVAVGRFSTNSLLEFSNMVDKTISYEKYYNSINQVLLVAHSQYAPNGYQQCCNSILSTNYSENITFKKAYGAISLYGGTNARNDSIIQSINLGANIVNYRGHGGINLWGKTNSSTGVTAWNDFGEAFYSSQIDSMSQDSKAVFFSIACNTGDISGTCMLESFTRSPHGASAFVGATTETDMNANDTYNEFLIKKLLNDSIYHIGDLNNAAHIQNIGTDYSASKDCAFSYICGGDPSLEIWTSPPVLFGEVDISSQNDSIIIHVDQSGSYFVSIVNEDGGHMQTFMVSGNRFSIPKLQDKLYLSIYRHNVSPYVAYYDSVTDFIQAKTFSIDSYYEHSPLVIGEYVDPNGEIGEVTVKKGTKLSIKTGIGGTTITDSFECEKGGVLIIK